MNNQYYELEDLISLLKKSRSTIIRDTNTGKIPSEGEKRNRKYPKEAIDALVEIEKRRSKDQNKKNFIFSSSSPNDSWQEVQIGRELYGEDDIVPYKKLLEWGEINDDMYRSLKINSKVAGYSSLMPVDEAVIISLVKDEIRERDIPDDAIKQWTDPQISVYVASVTVKPTGKAGIDSERAGIIIANTVKWALAIDRQASIKNWYSIGATEDGQNLLEKLGFKEIISLYGGERKGYFLDDISAPSRFISRIMTREKMREFSQ